ncbi:cell division protein FtsQ/DivIB [Anaerosalibacter massiliensis]|uniref:FtsQ-type POTRA domain-containing protein n=1 Tax=Anaerosalibacter massiliensis TaxID=1347392 RepID=A0A9X2MF61_9FIRM|nr:FtsQ-type POTRA domain-containing protein [Anaerosalibacter massiliensis]MCR2042890.1 FtsQ-type POTRA domain-containing protein [Anaerosalibacter massiliensis]
MTKKVNVDKKSKKKQKGIIFFIFLMIFFIFIMISFKTNLFNISSMEVEGNENLSEEEVVNAAGNYENENIFRVNTKKMEMNLKYHPYVKEANVKRKYPDKLVIKVLERKEKFIIPYMESYVYSDDEGIILRIESEADTKKIPAIKGIDIERPKVKDEVIVKNDRDLNNLKEIIQTADEFKLLHQIESINLSKKENINIELRNGIKVAFGPSNNVKYKLRYLYSILEDISKKDLNCKYIYFNKGENPIIVTDDK